jgi:hypothetical protein
MMFSDFFWFPPRVVVAHAVVRGDGSRQRNARAVLPEPLTVVGGSTGQSSDRLTSRIEVGPLLLADRLRRLTLIALEVVDDAPADVCGQRGALPVESAVPVERRTRAVIDGIELGTEELVADAGFEFRTVALKVLFGQLTSVGTTTGDHRRFEAPLEVYKQGGTVKYVTGTNDVLEEQMQSLPVDDRAESGKSTGYLIPSKY